MNEWPMRDQGEITTAPSDDGPQVSLFGGVDEQLERQELVDPKTLARTDDPETSHAAAARIQATAMRGRLLSVFASGDHTAEEAARHAGYTAADGAWKRVSDLKNLGFIKPTGTTRPGSSGRYQDVLRITESGRGALA